MPPGAYSSMWGCATTMYRVDGSMAFFRGLNASLLRALPLHATVFVVYEKVASFLTPY